MNNEAFFSDKSFEYKLAKNNTTFIQNLKEFANINPEAKVLVDDITMQDTFIYICKNNEEVERNIDDISRTANDEEEDADGFFLESQLKDKVFNLSSFIDEYLN